MILPIVAYGDPVLRKKAEEINKDYEGLDELIDSMFITINNDSGVGLAAPQIGRSIRLFVVDTSHVAEEDKKLAHLKNFKKVFINPIITKEYGKEWTFNEGCLSIPHIREDISRESSIQIQYYDEKFVFNDETYSGYAARIMQHEYDHLKGILFTDYLSPLKKRLLKKKLTNISQGKVQIGYKMKFPKLRNK